MNVNLDPGQPAYDPRLPEVIRSLKGRQAEILAQSMAAWRGYRERMAR